MSQRGVFDLRVHVQGETRREVFDLIAQFANTARHEAPYGVDVKYWKLRAGRTPGFEATIEPKKGRR